jgi:hypothetical protein
MSSVWQQTTFAPGHDTSVTIQHESLPWVSLSRVNMTNGSRPRNVLLSIC